MRPTYSDTALFVGSDSGATDHNSIAVSSDTVLLVEKAHGVQIGTRDLKEPLLNVIRIERFGRCATSVCYGVSAISTVYILGRCSAEGPRCCVCWGGGCCKTLRRKSANP